MRRVFLQAEWLKLQVFLQISGVMQGDFVLFRSCESGMGQNILYEQEGTELRGIHHRGSD